MDDNRFVHAVCNGELVEARQAVLSVTSPEVQYGFGVYESLRVIHSHVVYLDGHLERLMNSARGVGLEHAYTTSEIASWVGLLVSEDGIVDATMRILMVGGRQPLLFITASDLLSYPVDWYETGVAAVTFKGERFMPKCKTNSLLLNYIALREARRTGAFESLLVNRYGRVLEGTRSNVFAVLDDTVFTAADDDVLEGVTRDKIVKAIARLGLNVCFQAPALEDLARGVYDEVFISSTSMGALPLCSIDGIPCKSSFPVTARIHGLIRSWELEELH
jgi:D-alanine transaminase/branched-chain amino acid aminotransferase